MDGDRFLLMNALEKSQSGFIRKGENIWTTSPHFWWGWKSSRISRNRMKSTLEMPSRGHHLHHPQSHHSHKHLFSSRKSSRSSGNVPSSARREGNVLNPPPETSWCLTACWARFTSICGMWCKGNRIQEQEQHQHREGSGSNQGSLASESSYFKSRVKN